MSDDRTYMFTLDGSDPDVYKVMSQEGVHYALGTDLADKMNCCWEGTISPSGEFYFSFGSEQGKGGFAMLNRYDLKHHKIECLVRTEEILSYPKRAMPGSKLHTCVDFLPDGRIIFVNHNTDRAPDHPEWLPYAYYSHMFEGFPGSSIFIYDPNTGKTENLGVPVPRESIYGGVYDPKHNVYYMIGYFLGHIYCYDLTTRQVTDLGKAVEHTSHRIHLGPDGNVYGSTKSGYLFRVNTQTNKLEYTGIRFPESKTNIYHNIWYRYVTDFFDVDDHTMLMVLGWGDDVYEYDTNNNTLTTYSKRITADDLFKQTPGMITCFNSALDKYGVLWYSLSALYVPDSPDVEYYVPGLLFCWDYKKPNAKPECLGVLGTPQYDMKICSHMAIDKERDILYATQASDLMVMCVELEKFRKHRHERSGILEGIEQYPQTIPPEKRKENIEEGMSHRNAHQAFPTTDVFPVRIWPNFPGTETASSAVIGLTYEESGTLWALTGDRKPEYAVKIVNGAYVARIPIDRLDEEFKKYLLENCVPKEYNGLDDLPFVAGRQYLSQPNAIVDWNNGRKIIGTKDGQLAILNGDEVYALGQTAPMGPVRALCVNKNRNMLWGTVGDQDEFGRVFTYDDRRGLRQLGFFHWTVHSENGMIIGIDVLSSLALSPDEKWLAVGAQDRLGTVLLIKINEDK